MELPCVDDPMFICCRRRWIEIYLGNSLECIKYCIYAP